MTPQVELEMSGGRVASFVTMVLIMMLFVGLLTMKKIIFHSPGDSDSEYDDNNFIQSKATAAAGPFSPYPPETTAQLQTNTESIQVNDYEDEVSP